MVRWYTSKYDLIYAYHNTIFHAASVTKLTTAENNYVQTICTYRSQGKQNMENTASYLFTRVSTTRLTLCPLLRN